MAVIDPVKVTVTNLDGAFEQSFDAPDFPTHPERGKLI